MRINELLIESQQLDEGPFTQAIGKVGGKIAKGVANIGKDLKTGFKAGYSGEEPPADTKAKIDPTMDPAVASPKQAAPVNKAGGGFIDQFKKGFAQGRGEPAADPAASTAPTSSAATTSASTTDAAPVATATEPAEEPAPAAAKDGEGVTKLTQQVASLTTDLQGLVQTMNADKRDMLTDISNLKQQVAKLVKPSQAEIDADRARLGVGGSESVSRTGNSLAETLARKVQEQKQRMFETALANGQKSIFKK